MADATAQLLNQEAGAINALQYTPLDLTALQQTAEQDAAQNVAGSLALQQQYQPGVFSSNNSVQNLVASNIANPGNIPADVQAQVQREAGGQAGASGLLGSNAPYTAATLGNTALNLTNQRIQQSEQLSAANPSPVSGLNPASLAGYATAQNNAQNQFGLSKLQAQQNLGNSYLANQTQQAIRGNQGTQTGFGLPGGNQSGFFPGNTANPLDTIGADLSQQAAQYAALPGQQQSSGGFGLPQSSDSSGYSNGYFPGEDDQS